MHAIFRYLRRYFRRRVGESSASLGHHDGAPEEGLSYGLGRRVLHARGCVRATASSGQPRDGRQVAPRSEAHPRRNHEAGVAQRADLRQAEQGNRAGAGVEGGAIRP